MAAHEFTHYVDLVRRLSRTDVLSDERVSTLFEAGYADEERVVSPSKVFAKDKPLARLVEKRFTPNLTDQKLDEKVSKGWIAKGLPTRRVATEENNVRLDMSTGREDEVRPVAAREDKGDGSIAHEAEVRWLAAPLMGERGLNLQRLGPDETRQLLEVADDVVGDGGRALAVAAYGSKVAGYARPDSDYDIIVVAKKFKGRIRYQYVHSPVTAAALVVEEGLLESDAVKAYLGEFVSGRLLNIYEPLLNGDLIRKAEVESKKRVLAEEILEIGSQQGEFAQDLLIPLEYFLFDKLHKRALIYPPALYSYVKTYTCPSGEENKAFALEGFAEAALSLQSSGVLKVEAAGWDGRPPCPDTRGGPQEHGVREHPLSVQPHEEGGEAVRGPRLRGEGGVQRLQGRGALEGQEDAGEGRPSGGARGAQAPYRAGGGVHPPQDRADGREARDALGARCLHEEGEEPGGDILHCEAPDAQGRDGEGGEVRLQALRGHPLGEVGAPQRLVALAQVQHVAAGEDAQGVPAPRIVLRSRGVATPLILGAVLDDKVLVKEYIEGERLSDIVQGVLTGRSEETGTVERFGEAMGSVHRAGFALGDSKATNVIVKGDGAPLLH